MHNLYIYIYEKKNNDDAGDDDRGAFPHHLIEQ